MLCYNRILQIRFSQSYACYWKVHRTVPFTVVSKLSATTRDAVHTGKWPTQLWRAFSAYVWKCLSTPATEAHRFLALACVLGFEYYLTHQIRVKNEFWEFEELRLHLMCGCSHSSREVLDACCKPTKQSLKNPVLKQPLNVLWREYVAIEYGFFLSHFWFCCSVPSILLLCWFRIYPSTVWKGNRAFYWVQ